jgi:hypothetical protein
MLFLSYVALHRRTEQGQLADIDFERVLIASQRADYLQRLTMSQPM